MENVISRKRSFSSLIKFSRRSRTLPTIQEKDEWRSSSFEAIESSSGTMNLFLIVDCSIIQRHHKSTCHYITLAHQKT